MKKALHILLILLVNLLVLEAGLRLQQAMGPVIDLEMAGMNFDAFSDDLNHVPHRVVDWSLNGSAKYGEYAGHRYTVRRNELGVRIGGPPPEWGEADPLRVLFLGDSFVEGYDTETTISYQAREFLRERLGHEIPLQMLNAGHSSYAPSILIPQARNLIPVLNPDLVVVVIDQTDLGDDCTRYRWLIRWDEDDHIDGVRASPVGLEEVRGLMAIREAPTYIERLVRKYHHTRIHMPAFRRAYHAWFPRPPLWFAMDPEGSAEKYVEEIAFFSRNVDELIETVFKFRKRGK